MSKVAFQVGDLEYTILELIKAHFENNLKQFRQEALSHIEAPFEIKLPKRALMITQ